MLVAIRTNVPKPSVGRAHKLPEVRPAVRAPPVDHPYVGVAQLVLPVRCPLVLMRPRLSLFRLMCVCVCVSE